MSDDLVVNGWRIYFHPCFVDQMETLITKVERAKAKDPAGYKSKGAWLWLAAIVQIIHHDLPQDPGQSRFRQGGTLGPDNTEWRRVKFGGQRYRLFFRYHSPSRIIAIGRVNDENTLRTYGSDTDADRVFRSMLDRGHPPTDWPVLLAACREARALSDRLDGLI